MFLGSPQTMVLGSVAPLGFSSGLSSSHALPSLGHGGSTIVAQTNVTDDRDRLVAQVTQTQAVLPGRPRNVPGARP